jgi:hypothetical protein
LIRGSRPGRDWRFITHAPHRADHNKEIIFLEVPEPECIIFQYPDPASDCLLTAVWAEEGGRRRE